MPHENTPTADPQASVGETSQSLRVFVSGTTLSPHRKENRTSFTKPRLLNSRPMVCL